jgi:uncharacterized protein
MVKAMIVSFKFKNFYSFKDETVVSFENSRAEPTDGLYFEALGHNLSKAIMITGANGAGKSNVLKALSFIYQFMFHSFEERPGQILLYSPHFFSPLLDPSEFTLEFICGKKFYRYELHICSEKVIFEKLDVKNTSQYSYLFKREYNSKKGIYTYQDKNFGYKKFYSSETRQDTSIISLALQQNIALANQLKKSLLCITNSNLFESSKNDIYSASEIYNSSPMLQKKMNSILRSFDLGLSSIEIVSLLNEEGKRIYYPIGKHSKDKQTAALHFLAESKGTQSLFCLLTTLIPTLVNGGIAIVDELDTHLHIDMLNHILELFLNSHSNPNNAQIIFTSHLTEPMQVLDKYQILLVEKDKELVSYAWRIADIDGVRPDENIYKKYKSGAYGAIPNISNKYA